METKQKIKLLSDLQSAIDNPELKEVVQSIPSGEFIYEKICETLSEELNLLLSGKTREAVKQVDSWTELLKSLDRSVVLEILKTMNAKLSAGQEPRPQAAPGVAAQAENFPAEEVPVSQEELRRRWEEQQLNAGNRKNRGGSYGPY